jgi:hypothetical protein
VGERKKKMIWLILSLLVFAVAVVSAYLIGRMDGRSIGFGLGYAKGFHRARSVFGYVYPSFGGMSPQDQGPGRARADVRSTAQS